MRHLRREATDVLTQLAVRFRCVEITQPQPGTYSVMVGGRWYEAGTVEQALTRAGHGQLDRATGVSAEVQPPVAPTSLRKTA